MSCGVILCCNRYIGLWYHVSGIMYWIAVISTWQRYAYQIWLMCHNMNVLCGIPVAWNEIYLCVYHLTEDITIWDQLCYVERWDFLWPFSPTWLNEIRAYLYICWIVKRNLIAIGIFTIFGTMIPPFYPRPVLAFGYCRCLRLSVCVSVCAAITCLSAR